MSKPDHEVQPGELFQITKSPRKPGWLGVIVEVKEVLTDGIQGVMLQVLHASFRQVVPVRLAWGNIEYVGHASIAFDGPQGKMPNTGNMATGD